MSSRERPELRAVPAHDPPTASPSTGPAAPAAASGRRGPARRWPTILLLGALVVACFGYLRESQRAGELLARTEALEGDLAEARSELRAHEERMDVVRGHVDDLAGRVEALQQALHTPLEASALPE